MFELFYIVMYLLMGYLGYRAGIRRMLWLQILGTASMAALATWQYNVIVVGNADGHHLASGLHFVYSVAIPAIIYVGSTWITAFVYSRRRRADRTDGTTR